MEVTDKEFTEIRQRLTEDINSEQAERVHLENKHGQVWSTDQVRAEFEVLSFMAPFVHVRRKADNQLGTLMFQHSPRYYFRFLPE